MLVGALYAPLDLLANNMKMSKANMAVLAVIFNPTIESTATRTMSGLSGVFHP